MKAVYADPPYPGQAAKHYRNHPDFGGEVDHEALIAGLMTGYDAWALSTSTPALKDLLPLCPTARVAAWVKPYATWKPGVRVCYSWEPVIFFTPRKARGRKTWDSYRGNPQMGQAVRGQKSREFCGWLFDLLGLEPDDEFVDMFPGSGAVTDAWAWWSKQGRLLVESTYESCGRSDEHEAHEWDLLISGEGRASRWCPGVSVLAWAAPSPASRLSE